MFKFITAYIAKKKELRKQRALWKLTTRLTLANLQMVVANRPRYDATQEDIGQYKIAIDTIMAKLNDLKTEAISLKIRNAEKIKLPEMPSSFYEPSKARFQEGGIVKTGGDIALKPHPELEIKDGVITINANIV